MLWWCNADNYFGGRDSKWLSRVRVREKVFRFFLVFVMLFYALIKYEKKQFSVGAKIYITYKWFYNFVLASIINFTLLGFCFCVEKVFPEAYIYFQIHYNSLLCENFKSYVIVFVGNTAKVYDEDDYNDDYCIYFTFNYEINSIMLCIFSHLQCSLLMFHLFLHTSSFTLRRKKKCIFVSLLLLLLIWFFMLLLLLFLLLDDNNKKYKL